jgi:hypothetical protein
MRKSNSLPFAHHANLRPYIPSSTITTARQKVLRHHRPSSQVHGPEDEVAFQGSRGVGRDQGDGEPSSL